MHLREVFCKNIHHIIIYASQSYCRESIHQMKVKKIVKILKLVFRAFVYKHRHDGIDKMCAKLSFFPYLFFSEMSQLKIRGDKVISLSKANYTMNKTQAQNFFLLEYSLLKPKFPLLPAFIQEVYYCLNTSQHTRNGATGSGHFI